MRLSLLILGWACYYLPSGVSCCPFYLSMGSPGAHWVLTRSVRAAAGLWSEHVVALCAPRTERQWKCSRDAADGAAVWSNKVTGSGRNSSGSGRSGRKAVRLSRTNQADSGRVPQPSRLRASLKPSDRWSPQNSQNHRRRLFSRSLIFWSSQFSSSLCGGRSWGLSEVKKHF